MVEARKAGVGPGKREQTRETPTDRLKDLIDGYVRTAALQSEYRALHQSLPNVLALAGEILKKKEESAQAFDQGLDVVEKVLGDASQKAEALSKAMADQHEALSTILTDRLLLTDILKSGSTASVAAAFRAAGYTDGGAADASNAAERGMNPATGTVANQLNAVMANIREMVAKEVQRQTEILRTPSSGRTN